MLFKKRMSVALLITLSLSTSTIYGANATDSNENGDSFYTPDKYIVLQDFGHSFHDGSVALDGVKEYEIARKYAMAVKDKVRELSNNQIIIIENPENLVGNFLSVDKRVDYAKSLNADLVISYHSDSADNKNANGTHSIIASNQKEHVKNLASKIADATSSGGVDVRDIKVTERSNTSEQGTSLAIMRDSISLDTPTILTELGFTSNEHDYSLLSNDAHLNTVSTNIAKTIVEAFNSGNFDKDQTIENNYNSPVNTDENIEKSQKTELEKDNASDDSGGVANESSNATETPVETTIDTISQKEDLNTSKAETETSSDNEGGTSSTKEGLINNIPTLNIQNSLNSLGEFFNTSTTNTSVVQNVSKEEATTNNNIDNKSVATKTETIDDTKVNNDAIKSEAEKAVQPFKEKVEAAKNIDDIDKKLDMLKDAIETFNNTKIFQ